jgi:hypothetical protein
MPSFGLYPLRGSRFVSERLQTHSPSHRRVGGHVGLDNVIERYFPLSTCYDPVHMFNPGVLEQRAGLAPAGRYFNASR